MNLMSVETVIGQRFLCGVNPWNCGVNPWNCGVIREIVAWIADLLACFVLLWGDFTFCAWMTLIGHRITHPVNFPCGRKPEYPEETHDFRQSVDFYSFHMRTGFESHWESSHWDNIYGLFESWAFYIINNTRLPALCNTISHWMDWQTSSNRWHQST
jgi:hypothetical protein